MKSVKSIISNITIVVLLPGTIQAGPPLSLESPDSSSCCLFASGAQSHLLQFGTSYPLNVTFRVWSLGKTLHPPPLCGQIAKIHILLVRK